MQQEQNRNWSRITLTGDLRARHLDGIVSQLLFSIGRDLEIDLSQAENVDSATIQLMLSLRNELRRSKNALRISNASGDVKKLFLFYGLDQLLVDEGLGHERF